MKYVYWNLDTLFPWGKAEDEEGYAATEPLSAMLHTVLDTANPDTKNAHFFFATYRNQEEMQGKKLAFLKAKLNGKPIFVPEGASLPEYAVKGARKFRKVLSQDYVLIDHNLRNLHAWKAAGGMAIKAVASKGDPWDGYKTTANGDIIPPAKTIIREDAGINDLVVGIWRQALIDLADLKAGKNVEGASINGVITWMGKSPYGVDGDKVLAAIKQHGISKISCAI